MLQPPEVWDGGVGFVSKEMIQTHCPAPAADIQVAFYTFVFVVIELLLNKLVFNFLLQLSTL